MGVDNGTLEQLLSKRRTYEDLSRFMGERITGVPNYALLLGAGCSVSSGIRCGSELVSEWRREMFARLCPSQTYSPDAAIAYLNKNEANWYNSSKEYSSLFERIYDLPRQRRMFVEKEVSSKDPNLGYAYLTKLVDNGFVNTIFTTNFDDLINESFFRFSQTRPMVCAHDSSISSITVTSKRPKVIKLHGDYLFDDIKSTVRETESLEDNTRKKFIEFGRDFGLVVIGYNGGDRSVMDVLQYLLRGDEYFKNGIYWCLRKGERPSEELTKLLWKDRVYYVEIDGFDETMASLHNDLVGLSLPVDTSLFTDRPREIISKFCENSFLSKSPSLIIQRDLSKLKVQEGREHFLSAMRDMRKGEDERGEVESELSDRHLVKLMEINQLIRSDDFFRAREEIGEAILSSDSIKFKERLYLAKIRTEEMAGDGSAALATIDKLIELDPNNAEWLIRKSYLLSDFESQLEVLAQAQRADPEYYRIYDRHLDCLIEMYNSASGVDSSSILKEIDIAFDLSIKYDPSLRNESWASMRAFIESLDFDNEEFVTRCDKLIERCGHLGLQNTEYLRLKVSRLSKNEKDRHSPASDELLAFIAKVKLGKPRSHQVFYQWLELDALESLKRKAALRSKFIELSSDPDYVSKRGYLKRYSNFIITYDGSLDQAIDKMQLGLADQVVSSDVLRIATLLRYRKDGAGIAALKQKYWSSLDADERLRIEVEECEAVDDFDGVLRIVRKIASKHNCSLNDVNGEVHALLKLGRSSDAMTLAKSRLDAMGWRKKEGSALIVNFELARRRVGEKVDKARLAEVAELTQSDGVAGCCYYLIDSADKAKTAFLKCFDEDREIFYLMQNWAIFDDSHGKSFLARLSPPWFQRPKTGSGSLTVV